MLLIIFYKMSDALVMALSTNFLLNKLGFSLAKVGTINKTFGLLQLFLALYMAAILCKKCRYLKPYLFLVFYRLFLILVIDFWQ